MSQKRGKFKVEEKDFLVSCLTGYEQNIYEGVLLLQQILDSSSKFLGNWRSRNLSEDELMNISSAYDEVSSNLNITLESLVNCLDSIFQTENLFESKEKLQAMFLEKEDLEVLTKRIKTIEEMHLFYNKKIRNNYLEVLDKKKEVD
ncbi:TPA: hypothetical protein O0379_002827 [Staphylococcus aureus]|uniref:hypothetical protein n=1 Tax=Staphylococcus TaxID=1279 RepID=UPI0008A939A3|nr:hypothetical protein [Staphylococcus aureus]OHS77748.1 hypothetical protein HMPREF3284_00025 [Staphylococcus aureus]HCY0483651.1 hypothetical protein [Staphylococcus aureus]HDC9493472.1 hypothetical protein [Staphylococcus aureus]HDE3255962.1 hypothetical protein [Staphylococcus aureus]HDJ2696525.1 hypothetical protein [Staphylococcus aureus]